MMFPRFDHLVPSKTRCEFRTHWSYWSAQTPLETGNL